MAEAIPRDGVHVEGFNKCYWSDPMIQDIIQNKILKNGWELHQQSGGKLGYRATITKWIQSRSEKAGMCWRPVFEVIGRGDSNTEAILDAYIKAVVINGTKK